jgi:DNA-binding transcriptional LysR family regulator
MPRLLAYPVFHAAYEERRFVKAAERLCLTPSAVSHALRDFEDRLGVQLFERTPDGLVPTLQGKLLYEKTKPLLTALEMAEKEVQMSEGEQPEEFTFASIHTFIKGFFVPILERLHKNGLEIKVHLLTRSMAASVEAVADGEALIGSSMLPMKGPERFRVVPLAPIPECFVISRELYRHCQSQRPHPEEPWSLEEILQQPLITLPRDSASFATYRRYFSQYGLKLEPRYEVHQEDLGFDLAHRGLGIFIGFSPAFFEHPEVEVIPCRSPLPARELVLFCSKASANGRTLRLMKEIALAFSDLLKLRQSDAA